MPRDEIDIEALVASAFTETQTAYRDFIAGLLLGRDDPQEARTVFRENLARSFVIAMLMGRDATSRQLRLPARPAPELPKVEFAKVKLSEIEIDLGEIFGVGPFDEAVAAFQDRVAMSRDDWERLVRAADAMSRAIANVESREALQLLSVRSNAIQRAVRESFFATGVGGSAVIDLKAVVSEVLTSGLAAFTDERGKVRLEGVGLPGFIKEAELAGAENLTDARLELIFRNNVRSAFNDGKVRQLSEPAAQAVAPLVILSNPGDARSRPAHKAMNGYINTLAEFLRMGIVPLNGHHCRCSMRPVTNFQAKRLGLLSEDGTVSAEAVAERNGSRQDLIDSGEYPDTGWVSRPLAAA